jgi:hypothetical protein
MVRAREKNLNRFVRNILLPQCIVEEFSAQTHDHDFLVASRSRCLNNLREHVLHRRRAVAYAALVQMPLAFQFDGDVAQ